MNWGLRVRNRGRKETSGSASVVPLRGKYTKSAKKWAKIESREEGREETKHLRLSGGSRTLTPYTIRLNI